MPNYRVVKISSQDEMKDFLRIFDYWHKQGMIGFVPIFILYRARDKGELIGLKKGNKIIGIAWMIHRKRPYEFFQMKTLAIDKDFIGKGLGKTFLHEMVRTLHKFGWDITTSVLTSNERALQLYLSEGFKIDRVNVSPKGIETYEMKLEA